MIPENRPILTGLFLPLIECVFVVRACRNTIATARLNNLFLGQKKILEGVHCEPLGTEANPRIARARIGEDEMSVRTEIEAGAEEGDPTHLCLDGWV